MQRLNAKYNGFSILKNKDGLLVAEFKKNSDVTMIAFAVNNAVHNERFKTSSTEQFTLTAIQALRQIHPRMAQSDKDLLDRAARQLQEGRFKRCLRDGLSKVGIHLK